MAENPTQTRTLSGRWKLATEISMGGVAVYYVWASTVGVVSLQYFRGIAILYSLVESAKLNGIDPKSYLKAALANALAGERIRLPHEPRV